LQAAVASCSRCGLCKTRRHTVFGVGHPRAAVMVVGEAPGEQEDRQGEPFVGAAGQLLDRMLGAIGLSRTSMTEGSGSAQPSVPGTAHDAHQVFITNTVKCRPPQNRNPEPAELAACEPVLHRQMELVRPRLVLAMGRFAAQQLLHTDEAIGRLRGRVHRITGAGAIWAGERGVPVVVTYHPAYLLRNPIDKAKAWDDLCLALDTLAAQA
jgi:DNA polymerase